MTTVSAARERVESVTRSPVVFVPLMLGALMLAAYFLLPLVNQPELGATTVPTLTADRDNNELDVVTNGLRLLWLSGFVVVLIGVYNTLDPRIDKTAAVLTTLAGVIGLVYYGVFIREYLSEEATYFSAMAYGYWVMLGLAVAMVAQVVLPREKPLPQFRLGRTLGNQEMILLSSIVVLLVVVGITNPRFLAERNLLDILQGNAYIAVAAIGMSMVIITGNIDISVGSLVGLLAIISGRLVVNGAPIWMSWMAPLVFGALVGAVIGFLVAYMRIPSIVVTLGFLSILRGGLIIWTNGERVTGMPEAYYLAQMRPLGVPMTVWFMVVLTVLAALYLRYSEFGRSLYAVGGNSEAAHLSGINEQRVVLTVFIINGIFVGIASTLYATQLRVIQATPPPFLELTIITASVVGGVSILGGTGTVIGATLAAVLLNMIRSAMVFINVDPFWLRAVQGVLILATVLADLLRRQRQRGQ